MLLFRSKSLACRLSPLVPAFHSSIYRFHSTSPTQEAPSPSRASRFAVEYLINSCGLPSDKAARASRYLPHLKSPDKPNAALRFLRQVGVSETHITAAVSRDPRFLCFSVEKCLQPKMSQLQELGFSPSHISLLLSICPTVFGRATLQRNVLFWLGMFDSIEELLAVLRYDIRLLTYNIELISVNLSFLEKQCALSASQIVRLIKLSSRLITSSPQALKNKAKRAEELGIKRSSGMFLHALKVVNGLNQSMVDARIRNLRSLGFSQEEVRRIVSRHPHLLTMSEQLTARKMQFLIKNAGCDMLHLVNNPNLFSFSLEKRLFPRSIVRKILKFKGFPAANKAIVSFMQPNEKKFVKNYVMPYEPAIPGLLQAFEEACAGNVGRLECFMSDAS